MLMIYDVMSSMWQEPDRLLHVVKMRFSFQLLSILKVRLKKKMLQSTYLRVVFHVKHRKLPILAVFTRFSNSW